MQYFFFQNIESKLKNIKLQVLEMFIIFKFHVGLATKLVWAKELKNWEFYVLH